MSGEKSVGARCLPAHARLVSQKKVRIEHFHRQEDTTWQRRVAGPGERVELAAIGCDLEVDRAYLKVFAASSGAP